MKDIFIDTNIAKNFANPIDNQYKLLIAWLLEEGSLAVSRKLISEYHGACGTSTALQNITVIVDRLLASGRLVVISNQNLKAFRFRKAQARKLRSNGKDHVHIKTVMLSHRRYAIMIDDDLRYDINHFPGYHAMAVARPDDIDYRGAASNSFQT